MEILSEAKGVSMWLFNKTRNENFSQFILREFKKETEKSFYKITEIFVKLSTNVCYK